MPNSTFRLNNGQHVISDKYSRRINTLTKYNAYQRLEAAKDLKKGLQDATRAQLYNRTPLFVTWDMYKSIGVRINVADNTVTVGYVLAEGGPDIDYPKYRLNMKGRSAAGGHMLDMQPSLYIRRVTDPLLRKRARRMQRKILEGGPSDV